MNEDKDWHPFEEEIMDQIKQVRRKNYNTMPEPKYIARAVIGLYVLIFVGVIVGNIQLESQWTFKNWNDLIDIKLVSFSLVGGLGYFFYRVYALKEWLKLKM